MIIDASVVVDAVADPGQRGHGARTALGEILEGETLRAPGHLAIEVLSALRAFARRPGSPLDEAQIPQCLADGKAFAIRIDGTPWSDVERAWELSQASLRFSDGVYVAAAERLGTALLTSDRRIERSGAKIRCQIITIG